jgi:PadR family transcriptional regulator AphA
MSLRHAILGIVSAKPMTGYDLIKTFANSVAYTWSAGQAQIYPELHKMESDGLLRSKTAARGETQKRVYAISPSGERELRRWVNEPSVYVAERDALRLKTTYLELATPAAARAFFQAHIEHYEEYLKRLYVRLESVRTLSGPLLQARLKKTPAAEHELVIASKAFGVKGQIARADAEIAWAREGLVMLERLHPIEGMRRAPKRRKGAPKK